MLSCEPEVYLVPPSGQWRITPIRDQPLTMTSGPPRGATLSQRQSLWQMSVLLHPSHTKALALKSEEKNPPQRLLGFSYALLPRSSRTLALFDVELGDVNGLPGIRGAESLMSRLLARLAAFDASFGCVTAPSTLSGSWRHNADVCVCGWKWLHSNSCTGKHYISLCYIICNSILHYVKVNCQMYHLKQRFSTFVSKAPQYTQNHQKQFKILNLHVFQ